MKRLAAPLAIGLIGAAILVALGIWQVQRLHWKEGILAAIDAKIAAAPIPLPEVISPADHAYLPVALDGRFGEGALFVLISTREMGAGWRVISDFQTTNGRRVLVDRGITPLANKEALRQEPRAQVIGNLHWPDDRNSSTPQNDLAGNTWFARDIAEMAETLGTEPLLIVAREVTPADQRPLPMPLSSAGIPNKHFEYAGTWFLLALAWTGMTGLWIRRRLQDKD